MSKSKGLIRLLNKGLNIHEFKVCTKEEELKELEDSWGLFSIRFDSEEHKEMLPFYKYRGVYTTASKLVYREAIVEQAKDMGCTLLCANGLQYDPTQLCNYVYKLNSDKQFELELSFEQIPLRDMYNGNTICITGNIFNDGSWNINCGKNSNRHYLSKSLVYSILDSMVNAGIYNHYCECTLYPTEVGVLNKRYVYWQVI